MNLIQYFTRLNAAQRIALLLSTVFLGIVLIERLPGVLVPTDDPHEWLMFGLFQISLLDDITHGISGVLGFIALAKGYRATVYYLMLIGGYYALDALFFIAYGVAAAKPLIENVLLNLPHVLIAVLVFLALRRSVDAVALA